MLMLTTRIGDHSKLVITGDLKQSDRTLNNGLLDIIEKLKIFQSSNKKFKNANVELIELDNSDVQRSPIVSQILEIYNSSNNSNKKELSNFISSIDHFVNDDAALIPKNQLPKREQTQKDKN